MWAWTLKNEVVCLYEKQNNCKWQVYIISTKSHPNFVKCTEIEHKIWPLTKGFVFELSWAVVKPSWQSNRYH
jgi:hypothetical protein